MLDAYIIEKKRESGWQRQPLRIPAPPMPEYPPRTREKTTEPGTKRGVLILQL